MGWDPPEATTKTEETEIDTWPVWVKPNFSKRIMGRVSEVMVRVLISAAEGEMKKKRRRRVATALVEAVMPISER